MCGIAGFLASAPLAKEDGHALLTTMLHALRHRGPDERGTYVSAHCGLACARLAIVDIANGHMPVSAEDGRTVAVMNGEIYNYKILRARLSAAGHRLSTDGDSEVLPHLYEEYGADVPQALTGMFAFAIWDARARRLLLGRDRFGIKPLLTAKLPGLLLFASEAKALLATGKVDRTIDPRALIDLGTAGYPMPPRTMFRDIRSISPATIHTLGVDGSESASVYFRVPYPGACDAATPDAGASMSEAAPRVASTFDEVVREHMMGDVGVGGYLSGGIDSTSVAMTMCRVAGPPIQTFAMTFDDPLFDESRYSDMAASAMGADHVKVFQGPISDDDYRGTIRAMEAPQLSTVPFCAYRLARAVRRAGLKVVLSGEGADEIFAGYNSFRQSKVRRENRQGPEAMLGQRDGGVLRLFDRWFQLEAEVKARYGLMPPAGEKWWSLAGAWHDVLDPDVLAAVGDGGCPIDRLPERPPHLECERLQHVLHKELVFEQRTRLEAWVLAISDRAAMAHSVEVRVPFLDHRLVALTAAVPPAFLLHGFVEKHLLRESMRGRIPEPIRVRTKRGFGAPVEEWLFGANPPDYVREALTAASLHTTGICLPQAVDRLRSRLAERPSPVERASACAALHLVVGVQVFAAEFAATR
jgi:asparagine synthase (glutamine-hydrolysing)